MAAPILTINAAGELEIAGGTEGNPVTWNDVWDWDDGGGSSGGDGDVPIDGGGTAKVNTYITEIIADRLYRILDDISFGDTSTSSYFQSKNEMVYFDDNKYFFITSAATLELGDLANGYGVDGSFWNLSPAGSWLYVIPTAATTATFIINGSRLHSRASGFYFAEGAIAINRGQITYDSDTMYTKFDWSVNSINISGLWHERGYGLWLSKIPSSFNNVQVHEGLNSVLAGTSMTFAKFLVTGARQYEAIQTGAATLIVKDPIVAVSLVRIDNASGGILLQYTCNIHITDKAGADLASVDVDCEYAHLVEGSDSKTYKCIQDHTAIDAIHKPITGSDWASFWELYDASGGLGGDWNTGFGYKSGTEEFSTATTDADGNITEQDIQYKKWTGTSEVLEVRIHTFTFSHASYPDSVMSGLIVDHFLLWEFDMGQSTSDLTAIMDAVVAAILEDTGTNLPATLADIAGYIDTEVAAIKAVTDNLPNAGALSDLATKLEFLQDVFEGDAEVDTAQTPWQLVIKKKGTGEELVRKDLFDASGGNIIDTTTAIGQQKEPI